MQNYPVRRESSDLEQYQAKYYDNPTQQKEISFLCGVKRLVWVFMCISVWGIAGLLMSAYQSNAEKWNSLAFGFVVCVLLIIIAVLAGIGFVMWANYAGVSIVPVKNHEPIPTEHEYFESNNDDSTDTDYYADFPRQYKWKGQDWGTEECNEYIVSIYDALKESGEYAKTKFVQMIFNGQKAPLYVQKTEEILKKYGRKL